MLQRNDRATRLDAISIMLVGVSDVTVRSQTCFMPEKIGEFITLGHQKASDQLSAFSAKYNGAYGDYESALNDYLVYAFTRFSYIWFHQHFNHSVGEQEADRVCNRTQLKGMIEAAAGLFLIGKMIEERGLTRQHVQTMLDRNCTQYAFTNYGDKETRKIRTLKQVALLHFDYTQKKMLPQVLLRWLNALMTPEEREPENLTRTIENLNAIIVPRVRITISKPLPKMSLAAD
jgi:hypothetical protein